LFHETNIKILNSQKLPSTQHVFLVKTSENDWVFMQTHQLRSVAHLTWKKGVCYGRAAFDITIQHTTALFLKTRNRPMKFAMFPKYHIGKLPQIYNISAIFAHKRRCASCLHGGFGNPSCYFVYD